MSEQQRVAIVTGAAGGIGRDLVRACSERGSRSRRSTAPPKVSPSLPKPRRSGSTAPTS